MVETPGTAPGSDPLIASAFISIVPKDNLDIGGSCTGYNHFGSDFPYFVGEMSNKIWTMCGITFEVSLILVKRYFLEHSIMRLL